MTIDGIDATVAATELSISTGTKMRAMPMEKYLVGLNGVESTRLFTPRPNRSRAMRRFLRVRRRRDTGRMRTGSCTLRYRASRNGAVFAVVQDQ